MTTELCAYSIEACETARRAGVARVELCASPYEGGTTPSAAAIRMARRIEGLQLSVMIRPRGGDFLYDDAEFRQMLEEVRFARECGADGVVFGLLTPDGRVDTARTAALVAEAGPMQTTFHRAFDMTCDLSDALEEVVRTGCTRILTSGGRNTASEGIGDLRALVVRAAGRIEIMAGSGVNPSNVRQLAATGVDALHFSARGMRPSGMAYRNPQISMGGCPGVPEYASPCADERTIRQILNELNRRNAFSSCFWDFPSAPAAVTAAVFPPNTNPCSTLRWPTVRAPTACGSCCARLRVTGARGWLSL